MLKTFLAFYNEAIQGTTWAGTPFKYSSNMFDLALKELGLLV